MNKVTEATEWTEHRLEPLSGYPYYKLRAGDYRASSNGTKRTIFSGSKQSATDETSTTVTSLHDGGGICTLAYRRRCRSIVSRVRAFSLSNAFDTKYAIVAY